MADKIRGVTIKLGADTSEFASALKNANNEIKNTQKELKDVDKALKLDPKNIDLLKQKEELLNKSVGETKDKLSLLKDEQKKLDDTIKNGGQVDKDTYNALTREISTTERQLADLEKQTKSSNAEWQKFSLEMKDVSKSLETASQKTKGLSMAGGAVASGLLANAVNAGKMADKLNTVSAQTGISTDTLQKFRYASERIDVSVESMTGALTKMTMKVVSSESKFNDLGVATRDANGELRSSEDIFFDTVKALSSIENGTERDIVSMEIFGKSANQLTGIIDDGGESLKALGTEAEEAGLILSQDALNGANEFNNGLDKMKATATQAFFEAGASLAQNLLPMLESLVEWVGKVLQWFGNLDGGLQKTILVVAGLIASISPILSLFSKITGLISGLGSALTFFASPVGIAVLAIGGLIAIGVALYKNWDTIKEYASKIWNNISQTISGVVNTIVNTFSNLWSSIQNIWNGIWGTISGVVNSIKGIFNFSWSFPKPKMPHFTWWWEDVAGGLLKLPKFSIQWYAKAMDNGMILNSPTIFGMQNGRLLGAGERGSEVVVGTNSLMSMIQKATQGSNMNITINAPEGMNVNQLAQVVMDKIQRAYDTQKGVY